MGCFRGRDAGLPAGPSGPLSRLPGPEGAHEAPGSSLLEGWSGSQCREPPGGLGAFLGVRLHLCMHMGVQVCAGCIRVCRCACMCVCVVCVRESTCMSVHACGCMSFHMGRGSEAKVAQFSGTRTNSWNVVKLTSGTTPEAADVTASPLLPPAP